mmetsp:Transcript_31152/g.119861  ORF Transcript_31152/g.119861 Transcript_31152/m.119861 type:complete len:92 (-) Transcript_31152:97-372(-)
MRIHRHHKLVRTVARLLREKNYEDVVVEPGLMTDEQPYRAPDIQATHSRTHQTLFFRCRSHQSSLDAIPATAANRTGHSADTAAQRKKTTK